MYVYVCVSRGYYLVLDPEHVKIKKMAPVYMIMIHN